MIQTLPHQSRNWQKLSKEDLPPMEQVYLFAQERSPLYWLNLQATEFLTINQGGTSSGKSEAIIRVLFTIAIMAPKYVITVATNTIPKLKEDALRIALQVAELDFIKPFLQQYHATDRIFTFTNGSIMSFKSFENEEQAKGEKRHILYLTEATRVPYTVFYQLYLRTKVKVIVDYNPTDEFYIHTKVIKNPVEFPSVKVIRSWHIHNPYLSQEEHDKIERISDPDMHKVYARGLTGKLRGVIYSGWVQVPDPFPYTDGVLWGLDWGFSEKKTADPTAIVRIKKDPPLHLELDYLVDQVAYSQGLAPAHAAQVMKETGYRAGQPCYCDHATDSNYELQLHGITGTYQAIKGPGSILSGILFVRRKKIGYTSTSYGIAEEVKRYKFLEVDGIATNTPVDEYNHLMDATRYCLHTHALLTGDVK